MATEKSIREAESNAKHAYRVSLKFNKMFDYEIVQWLKKQDNKQAAIKDAIMYYLNSDDSFK